MISSNDSMGVVGVVTFFFPPALLLAAPMLDSSRKLSCFDSEVNIVLILKRITLSYGSRISSIPPRNDITRNTALCCKVDG